jgi:kynurenine formamidase
MGQASPKVTTAAALMDFSHPLRNGTIVGGDLGRPRFRQRATGHAGTELSILVTEFESASHAGTHVDAPRHFFPQAAGIDELPLEAFWGKATLVSVTKEPGEPITIDDILAGGPPAESGDILLIRTGWGRHYISGDTRAYKDHPYLAEPAAEWVVRSGLKMLATDTMSPDLPAPRRPAGGYPLPVHQLLLKSGVLIAENLNLEQAQPGRYEVFAFPLALAHGDGGPARIVGRPVPG